MQSTRWQAGLTSHRAPPAAPASCRDEPTTGLDARAASLVMSTVRATVNTGRTVVCTIHQVWLLLCSTLRHAVITLI